MDLGATKILTAAVDSKGNITERVKWATRRQRSPQEIIEEMAASIRAMASRQAGYGLDLLGVAVAAPGPLRYPGGIIENSPNLQWDSIALQHELSQRLGMEVIVEKDTNMAVLGVQHFDNPHQHTHLIYITVSSGIGGGIIAGGKLYRGSRGGAGEIGHMIIDPLGTRCGCGRIGCLEAEASGLAISRKAAEMLQAGKAEGIRALCTGTEVSAKEVGIAARQGDPDAVHIIHQAADLLAMGIANLVNSLNPEEVILGGGVILGLQDLFMDRIRAYVYGNVFPLHAESLEIRVTKLGEDIGILGCAAAVLHRSCDGF